MESSLACVVVSPTAPLGEGKAQIEAAPPDQSSPVQSVQSSPKKLVRTKLSRTTDARVGALLLLK